MYVLSTFIEIQSSSSQLPVEKHATQGRWQLKMLILDVYISNGVNKWCQQLGIRFDTFPSRKVISCFVEAFSSCCWMFKPVIEAVWCTRKMVASC